MLYLCSVLYADVNTFSNVYSTVKICCELCNVFSCCQTWSAHSVIFVLTLKCDLFRQRGCFWIRPLAHAEELALTAQPVCLSPGQSSVKEAPVQVDIHTRSSREAPAFSRSSLTLQVNPIFLIIYT